MSAHQCAEMSGAGARLVVQRLVTTDISRSQLDSNRFADSAGGRRKISDCIAGAACPQGALGADGKDSKYGLYINTNLRKGYSTECITYEN